MSAAIRRRHLVAFAAVVAIAATEPAASAQIAVDVQRRADAVVIEASATVDADIATAWRVLTDYDRYDRFVPGLRSSRVVERTAATVTVEQSGDAAVWLFRTPVSVTYEIAEHAPTMVRSRVVAGCTCTLDSVYVLTGSGSGVRLEYTGRLVAGSDIRSALEQAAGEKLIARHFQALADEIEREGARSDAFAQSAAAPKPDARDK